MVSVNMELECWEHSDMFVPDLVAIISASCRGIDTEVEVVVKLGPLDQENLSERRGSGDYQYAYSQL